MDDKVQKKLNQLMKLYSKNLPDKIHKLEHQWSKLKQKWDWILFHDFHREVHSLCGSAGTYGYVELSKAARQMEVFIKSTLEDALINSDNQSVITNYLNQLKLIVANELSLKAPLLESEAGSDEIGGNKIVYIMEYDEKFRKKLIDSLTQIGFSPYPIRDLDTFQLAVKEKSPIALIIDTKYLDKAGIQLILDIQQEQITPIQLFCIVPNGDILPRLDAIRAGCQAFFQKPVDIPHLIQIFNQKCNIVPGEPYKILIIDDSKSITDYYSLILNQDGMIAQSINNPLELLKELERFQPDLLLMDVYMPECTGFELAAVLRQEINYTKIPIIFLSTEEDKDKKLFAISLGGDDFLTKPVSPQYLISAVRARSKRANVLNYYMSTDSLTGLLNHSSILKQLEIELIRAKQAHIPLSFIMIDIDYFKKINDNYGHPSGDEVIKKLSTLFLTRLRSQDCVGRYGGEEFVLILTGSTVEDAKTLINNLRIQFSQHYFQSNNTSFFVTFSAGISYFDGTNDDPDNLISQADQALYKAKEQGRNQVVVFNYMD